MIELECFISDSWWNLLLKVNVSDLQFVAWTDYAKLGAFNQPDANAHAQWMRRILGKNPQRAWSTTMTRSIMYIACSLLSSMFLI